MSLIRDLVYLISGKFWNKLIYNTFYGLCSLFHAVFGDGNQSAHVPFRTFTGISTRKAGGGTSWPHKVVGCAFGHHILQVTQVLMGRCVNAQCGCVLCF